MPVEEIRPTTIVAIKERSAGNNQVGDMWLETAMFDVTQPIADVLEWARGVTHRPDIKGATKYGKLILTVPDDEEFRDA